MRSMYLSLSFNNHQLYANLVSPISSPLLALLGIFYVSSVSTSVLLSKR